MSQFDSHSQSQYLENLRAFMHMKKQDFAETAKLRPEQLGRKGRLPTYPTASVEELENAANNKALFAESFETTVGERMRIARDYQKLSDAALAREMDVSRELIRRWGIGLNRPSNFSRLALVLNVPMEWLKFGRAINLPANSHIGVRVGAEAKKYREVLFGMTSAFISTIAENLSEENIQTFIENEVMSCPAFAETARRAGGRWQFISGQLKFAAWVPLAERGLTRRLWSDEVEVMIEEELSTKHSIYAAWRSLKTRCEIKSLSYPKMINLIKRHDRKRKWLEKFGIVFNLPKAIV
jgi:DNA-binding transcriptional regulator YiaG